MWRLGARSSAARIFRVAVTESDTSWQPTAIPAWAVFAAAALAIGTVVRLGFSANAVAWGLVQVVLVGVAADDIANRRVKNLVTIPVSLAAVLLRVAFERSALFEVVIAGQDSESRISSQKDMGQRAGKRLISRSPCFEHDSSARRHPLPSVCEKRSRSPITRSFG